MKIAAFSLVVSSVLSWTLMRWLGPAGIALGSSLGGTLNVILHLRDLDRRIGTVLDRSDWRALAVAVAAALAAAAAGVGAASVAANLGPVSRAAVVLSIFGATYFALTFALRHPDAARLWTPTR